MEQRNKELEVKLKEADIIIQQFENKKKDISSGAERQIQYLKQRCIEKDEKEILELKKKNLLLMKQCTEIENKLKAMKINPENSKAIKKNPENAKEKELKNKNQLLEKKCIETENKLKATQEILIYL